MDIPAFPVNPEQYGGLEKYEAKGMSLRDWFASQALSAMELKNDGNYSAEDHKRDHPAKQAANYAAAAYRIADAMMAARAQ